MPSNRSLGRSRAQRLLRDARAILAASRFAFRDEGTAEAAALSFIRRETGGNEMLAASLINAMLRCQRSIGVRG